MSLVHWSNTMYLKLFAHTSERSKTATTYLIIITDSVIIYVKCISWHDISLFTLRIHNCSWIATSKGHGIVDKSARPSMVITVQKHALIQICIALFSRASVAYESHIAVSCISPRREVFAISAGSYEGFVATYSCDSGAIIMHLSAAYEATSDQIT